MKAFPRLTTGELVRDALLSAILFISQVSLAWISNVELVSLLLILYTLVFKKHVWLILYVFIALEGLVYGFGLWTPQSPLASPFFPEYSECCSAYSAPCPTS